MMPLTRFLRWLPEVWLEVDMRSGISNLGVLQRDSEAATAYQAHGTPSGYLIRLDGTTACQLALGP